MRYLDVAIIIVISVLLGIACGLLLKNHYQQEFSEKIVTDTLITRNILSAPPIIEVAVEFSDQPLAITDALIIEGDIYKSDVELISDDGSAKVDFQAIFHLNSERFLFRNTEFSVEQRLISREITRLVENRRRFHFIVGTSIEDDPTAYLQLGYVKNDLLFSVGYSNRKSLILGLGYYFW